MNYPSWVKAGQPIVALKSYEGVKAGTEGMVRRGNLDDRDHGIDWWGDFPSSTTGAERGDRDFRSLGRMLQSGAVDPLTAKRRPAKRSAPKKPTKKSSPKKAKAKPSKRAQEAADALAWARQERTRLARNREEDSLAYRAGRAGRAVARGARSAYARVRCLGKKDAELQACMERLRKKAKKR